jgi:hypothetical protein
MRVRLQVTVVLNSVSLKSQQRETHTDDFAVVLEHHVVELGVSNAARRITYTPIPLKAVHEVAGLSIPNDLPLPYTSRAIAVGCCFSSIQRRRSTASFYVKCWITSELPVSKELNSSRTHSSPNSNDTSSVTIQTDALYTRLQRFHTVGPGLNEELCSLVDLFQGLAFSRRVYCRVVCQINDGGGEEFLKRFRAARARV